MIDQSGLSSLGSQKESSFSEKPFRNFFGVKLPGATNESQKVATELMEKNRKFDLFFNEIGYHNHFDHHLLAAYACGGSPDLLKRIYEKYASYQRLKPPSKVTITRENWTEHLGQKKLWTDYLNFFDTVVKEDGMKKSYETFAFHPEMFPRFYSAVFHPMIHVGNGIEFELPLILAEGLTLMACQSNPFRDLLNDEFWSQKGDEKIRILDIIDEVGKDKRFDNVFTYSEEEKLEKLLSARLDIIREIAGSWAVPKTEEGIKQATRELYEACVLIFAAAAVRPDKEKINLDFYLMHVLTSMYFTFILLHYADIEKSVMLLRAHFATILIEWIVRGRPKLHTDKLKSYVPQKLKEEPNPWLDIIHHALIEDEEAHVIKVIRALIQIDQEWGPRQDNLYVKIAQLILEGYKKYGFSENVGFEEAWK